MNIEAAQPRQCQNRRRQNQPVGGDNHGFGAVVNSGGNQVTRGIGRARRSRRILRQAGAAADHPVHPLLPESAYLKAVVLQLD